MDLTNYQPLDTPVTVSRTDIGVIAKVDENDQPLQVYEILLAKKTAIIVRAIGARRASTPVKIELPLQWDPSGHQVEDAKYKFFKKKDVVIGPKSGKVKKVGPKREGPTKLDLCRAIWKANPNATRADMKAKFVAEAKCTDMGANTYYLLIKNEN